MNNSRGITLLLMIFIVLLLTVGSGVIASQVATDIRSARTYYESTRAFYIAWSSVANGRTWMTSGARRTTGGVASCTPPSTTNDCWMSASTQDFFDSTYGAGDIRRGGRDYSFQISTVTGNNALLGDGQIKVVGHFTKSDRVANRDPHLQTALLERTVWRDMKAFDIPLNNFQPGFPPTNAINTGATQCDDHWQEADSTGTLYVDFGRLEIVRNITLYHRNSTTASVTVQSWDDTTGDWAAATSPYVPTNLQTCTDASGPTTVARTLVAFGSDVETRRLRFNVTASGGANANIRDIQVTDAAGQNVRRQGSIRPGRFSYSTSFDPAQFN